MKWEGHIGSGAQARGVLADECNRVVERVVGTAGRKELVLLPAAVFVE